jgi:DNA polymerase III epsilon subunit family exonuclease
MIFSVIDVETTGLSPNSGDRVLEIGIVRMDQSGTIREELDTLVNPGRPVRATKIHGITDEMVADAPSFREILPFLNEALNGTIIAAHNASFDLGFLRAEYQRAGTPMPSTKPLCTLVLARKYFAALPSRSLESCRRHLGITDDGAHNALADARSAALVLQYFLTHHHHDTEALQPFRADVSKYGGPGLFDNVVEMKPRSNHGARV